MKLIENWNFGISHQELPGAAGGYSGRARRGWGSGRRPALGEDGPLSWAAAGSQKQTDIHPSIRTGRLFPGTPGHRPGSRGAAPARRRRRRRRDLCTPWRRRAGTARRSAARSVSRADTARPPGRQAVRLSVRQTQTAASSAGAAHRHEVFGPPLPSPTQTH